MTTADEILNKAEAAARAAAEAENATLPPEQQRGFDCGFAWVVLKPARGPLIAAARARKMGWRREYGGGGWEFPCSKYSPTQSISVHQAAAREFARVLQDHGYTTAYTGSRLD